MFLVSSFFIPLSNNYTGRLDSTFPLKYFDRNTLDQKKSRRYKFDIKEDNSLAIRTINILEGRS